MPRPKNKVVASPANTAVSVTKKIDSLAKSIRSDLDKLSDSMQRSLEFAFTVGEKLIRAKKLVGHGAWGKWLDDNFHKSARTARACMQLAEDKSLLPADSMRGLTINQALRLIAKRRAEEAGPRTPPEDVGNVNGVVATEVVDADPAPPTNPPEVEPAIDDVVPSDIVIDVTPKIEPAVDDSAPGEVVIDTEPSPEPGPGNAESAVEEYMRGCVALFTFGESLHNELRAGGLEMETLELFWDMIDETIKMLIELSDQIPTVPHTHPQGVDPRYCAICGDPMIRRIKSKTPSVSTTVPVKPSEVATVKMATDCQFIVGANN